MTHPILPSMSAAEIEAELRDSRRMIEARLARPAELFSYPNGDFDERTLAGVRRHYRAAVTTNAETRLDPHLMPNVHLPPGVLSLAWRLNHPPPARSASPRAGSPRRSGAWPESPARPKTWYVPD
jgi:peptidoglycan/xylan/chitin deacetylase (PgdA/CDA1 family)